MRMLLRVSWLAVSAASFLAAQRGGGGHFGGGGGGGFHASAPASHFSAPAARSYATGGGGYSGYNNYRAVVPPPSYGGHLTFSTPPANSFRYGSVGGRPPLRPPIRRPGGVYGYPYYGFGLYPYIGGFGFYGNDGYGYDPYYDSGGGAPYQDQYQPMMDPGAGYPPPDGAYPPVPYAPYSDQQQPAPTAAPDPDPPSTPITLILKSGLKFEVQNYAIVDGMFWDFSRHNAKRIPIASIDVAASAKATDEAGGAFPEGFFVVNPK